MGCVSSKQTVSVTPAVDHSETLKDNAAGVGSGRRRGGSSGRFVAVKSEEEEEKKKSKKEKKRAGSGLSASELGESGRASSNADSLSFRLGHLHKYIEGEQVAAGWPAWLSVVAAEAIQGWIPLRAESFEKLEKIGQGTYSTVFRARDLENGKIVALKKVRFDNYEPESVRFMAREIMILRRLDHPNIIKLEGLITSRLSCSLYLVFEYMEHDISGLLSCPDVKFSEAQIKCYMKQLLSGLEHCHSQGVMHRDIKGANLLVNNEGILKIADFGLANFCNNSHRQPLTSRVITLWYRPPELLLGSTTYGASVDLWSVGCVLAELLLGVPLLQGKTEVEQLHKIFKLCGSPSDDYWKKLKHPHSMLFKPQHPYESCLWESLKDLPNAAVSLIETLLSVEPCKRGTASSALASEYFAIKPYACDPSTLPKYPPSKEIDAKHHEEVMRRKKPCGRIRGPDTTGRSSRRQAGIGRLAPEKNLPSKIQGTNATSDTSINHKEEHASSDLEHPNEAIDVLETASHAKNASQGDIPFSGPLQVPGSSGFAWAKRPIDNSSVRSHSRSSSRSLIIEPSSAFNLKATFESKRQENAERYGSRTNSRGHESQETVKHSLMLNNWSQLDDTDSFDASDGYHSQELSMALYQRDEMTSKQNMLCQDQGDKVDHSGPLLSQRKKIDELLEKHERQIRQAVRRTWFQRARGHFKFILSSTSLMVQI